MGSLEQTIIKNSEFHYFKIVIISDLIITNNSDELLRTLLPLWTRPC